MNTLHILKTLKIELKKSKISYKDLAKTLKISEAGVKKIFTRDDLSLARALEICKALNISFSEVISQSEGNEQSELRFTDRQIDFLKKNISYFHFYMKLAYEQKSPIEIQNEFSLSLRSLNTYLKKLEELGLIKRHPKERTQIIGGAKPVLNTSGTELEQLKFESMNQLVEHLKKTKEGTLNGAGLYLTSDENDEFKSKWIEVLKTYSTLSNRNRKNQKSRATNTSVMFIQTPISMFNTISETHGEK
jgi:transcriptional regulator with XRE-family HTH domain